MTQTDSRANINKALHVECVFFFFLFSFFLKEQGELTMITSVVEITKYRCWKLVQMYLCYKNTRLWSQKQDL